MNNLKPAQLELSLGRNAMDSNLEFNYSDWLPLQVTPVFAAYWKLAAARQDIYFKRLHHEPPPWTDDLILQMHKFTNAYRAADRVSQYLIKHVIYEGDQTSDEVFFRIILFKIFNKIETWQKLAGVVGRPSWKNYNFNTYNQILTRAMEKCERIFSAAYIMPSGTSSFGFERKHANYLKLIETMMEEDVPSRLHRCKSMSSAFELLKSYPMFGDFLAYQMITDINYSEILSFSENDFVVAGPGAQDGITKCFSNMAGLSYEDIIRLVQKHQQREFARHQIKFLELGTRPLQLIDCQNLFCEVSKYSRVAFPDIKGISGRHRIKQKFNPHLHLERPWFPPKWGINSFFAQEN